MLTEIIRNLTFRTLGGEGPLMSHSLMPSIRVTLEKYFARECYANRTLQENNSAESYTT